MATAVELLDAAIAKIDALLLAGAKAAPIAVPKAKGTSASASKPTNAPPQGKKSKPATQPAKEPPAAAAAAAAPSGSPEEQLFAKALLKVAKVATVEDVENSDKLFKLTVDVGDGAIKHVCAGLKPYIARDVLLGSLVTVVLNLKPAKLAGNLSEAMVLAADTMGPDGKAIVRALVPPEGASAGDAVFFTGGAATTAPAKTLKSDDWKKIVALLAVQGGRATFNSVDLVTAKGAITLPAEIADGSGIH